MRLKKGEGNQECYFLPNLFLLHCVLWIPSLYSLIYKILEKMVAEEIFPSFFIYCMDINFLDYLDYLHYYLNA
jgi:hypothetical protein